MLPCHNKKHKYDIVACEKCGFIYADNIPNQKNYDVMYRESSKYVYNKQIPAGLINIHQKIFYIVEEYYKKNYHKDRDISIIDIGCSTGHLLSIFRENGYRDISGIEPSKSCCAAAKKLYGINVFNGTLSEYRASKKYDLVILSGVLEHMVELDKVINDVKLILSNKGMLLIVVPDVDKFSKNPREPFSEFSLEHINYFNRASLNSLLGKYFLSNVAAKDINAKFYNTGALTALYAKTNDRNTINKDEGGIRNIKNYIFASAKKMAVIEKKIIPLVESKSKIVIWGVGSLVARLLASTNLMKLNIKAFVDSNESMQGKRINGIEIYSPDVIKSIGSDCDILIGTSVYKDEIKSALLEKFKYKGNIVEV